MAAPTEVFVNGTGVISATGESSGLLLQTNKLLNRVTLGFRGTFTGTTVAVRGHATGLSATSYFPIPGVYLGSQAPVTNPLAIALTNSTNAAVTFDTTGCDYVEVWAVAGTLTDFNVDEWQFASDANTPPLIIQAQTSATTISANEIFTDNTVLYFGTGSDIGITWDGTTLNVSQAAADSDIYWGVSGAGINHTFYGDTAGRNMQWDQTNDQLLFLDNTKLTIGTGSDIVFLWDATDLLVSQAAADSIIKWGVSGAGINHVFYGDTATYNMTWDQTNDQLLFADNAKLAIGSGGGAAGDITFSWNATKMLVAQLTENSAIDWGVSGAGIDMVFYGDTAGANMTWDQSANALVFGAAANITFDATTGSKIGTATTQKIGFYNATPVVQPAANTDTTTGAAGGTSTVYLNTTYTGAGGTAAYTVGGVVTALKALGLLAP